MIVRDHLSWLRIWPQVSRKVGLLLVLDITVARDLHPVAGFVY